MQLFLKGERLAAGKSALERRPYPHGRGRARQSECRPDAPGLVLLSEDWTVEALTPSVERWLSELLDGDWEAHGKLPPSVLAVAGRALRTAEHEDAPGEVALARVLSSGGQ